MQKYICTLLLARCRRYLCAISFLKLNSTMTGKIPQKNFLRCNIFYIQFVPCMTICIKTTILLLASVDQQTIMLQLPPATTQELSSSHHAEAEHKPLRELLIINPYGFPVSIMSSIFLHITLN
jgi:hypothetical protein|uniref:Uncharacterized protein n=1 Tax=Zea mays TaxID=4577 RepID=A0A804RIA6_MAIZE